MKKLAYILFLMITFGCKSNSIFHKKPKTGIQTVLLSFNQLDYEPFGVLTKKCKPLPQFIELGKDTFTIRTDSVQFSCYKTGNNSVLFSYEESNYKLNGEFILPEYYHVQSKIIFDPQTFFTDVVQPIPFLNLIRNGDWKVTENGISRTINYNIKVDDSKIKKIRRNR